jgi:hypothetical protein
LFNRGRFGGQHKLASPVKYSSAHTQPRHGGTIAEDACAETGREYSQHNNATPDSDMRVVMTILQSSELQRANEREGL